MINRNFAMAATIVFALSVAGCKSKEVQLEGKWKASDTNVAKEQSNPMAAGFAKSLLSSFTVEFKPDKTYSMTFLIPIEGTWSLNGNTVTLTATKVMGLDVTTAKQAAQRQNSNSIDQMEKPMTATLSDDGKTLTVQNTSGKQGGMTFTKEAP